MTDVTGTPAPGEQPEPQPTDASGAIIPTPDQQVPEQQPAESVQVPAVAQPAQQPETITTEAVTTVEPTPTDPTPTDTPTDTPTPEVLIDPAVASPEVLIPPVASPEQVAANDSVDSPPDVPVDAPLGEGDTVTAPDVVVPVNEVVAPPTPTTLPEPGQIVDNAEPVTAAPYVAPVAAPGELTQPEQEAEASDQTIQTAGAVTELIPPPSSVGENDDKPLPTPEAVQAVRDNMPADVEQVIAAIASEAAADVVRSMVIPQVIVTEGLGEPGTPSS